MINANWIKTGIFAKNISLNLHTFTIELLTIVSS